MEAKLEPQPQNVLFDQGIVTGGCKGLAIFSYGLDTGNWHGLISPHKKLSLK
jgi:hypothetical protein